jgi:hypothetical protein
MTLKRVGDEALPYYKYGDTVYYPWPPLDGNSSVANIDDFDGAIREYMVLLQVHDQVVVTSKAFVEQQIELHAAYWNEKDEAGCYKCSTFDFERAATRVYWRDHLFATKKEALDFQKKGLVELRKALDRFEEKLDS